MKALGNFIVGLLYVAGWACALVALGIVSRMVCGLVQFGWRLI